LNVLEDAEDFDLKVLNRSSLENGSTDTLHARPNFIYGHETACLGSLREGYSPPSTEG
jgi:hypothetical protein